MELAVVQYLAAVRTPLITDAMLAVTALGSVTFYLILLPGLAYSRRYTALVTGGAVALAGTAELLLNAVVQRPRPPVEQVVVHAPLTSSFPSGHATLAFAAATVLAIRHGRRVYFLGLASLVAASRVYLGVHYPSDVVAGALLGVAAALVAERSVDPVLDRVSL